MSFTTPGFERLDPTTFEQFGEDIRNIDQLREEREKEWEVRQGGREEREKDGR